MILIGYLPKNIWLPRFMMNDLVFYPGFARDKSDFRVSYDEDYFNKCLSYEDKEIALKINRGRIDFVDKFHRGIVLDIGIGSGEFIKKRGNAHGYDVNPKAVKWLKENNLYSDEFEDYRAFTFWDVLEHIEEPVDYFKRFPKGSYVFTSLPVFDDLKNIKQSKHYRPGEHLWYWTEKGFIDWMGEHGFRFLERRLFEILAGREDIYSFAFLK